MEPQSPEFKQFEDYFFILIELLEGNKSNPEVESILEDYLARNRESLTPGIERLLVELFQARTLRQQAEIS